MCVCMCVMCMSGSVHACVLFRVMHSRLEQCGKHARAHPLQERTQRGLNTVSVPSLDFPVRRGQSVLGVFCERSALGQF